MADAPNDLSFRIRPTAERRDRTSWLPMPQQVIIHADGSAAVAYSGGEHLTRYESVAECLAVHGLIAGDLDPIDDRTSESKEPQPAGRGFAGMTPEQRRALQSKGGQVAHARGTAHKFTRESAITAARVAHERGTAHQWTAAEAREAGRKG